MLYDLVVWKHIVVLYSFSLSLSKNPDSVFPGSKEQFEAMCADDAISLFYVFSKGR